MYIYNFACHVQKCQNMYIKNKTLIFPRVFIFRFLPNFRKLNKITKSLKSINLKSN